MNDIIITGAKENNLRNVSVRIRKKQITVFTGVSGSGKSSLVFDTIGAEAQRQLNESYDSFIRSRLPHISPGAGRYGGRIVFEGTVPQLLKNQESKTAVYLERYLQQQPAMEK